MKRCVLLWVVGSLVAGCGKDEGDGSSTSQPASQPTTAAAWPALPGPRPADGTVREAAVAGIWYPAQPSKLAGMVDYLLSVPVARVPGKVRGMIVPHAGYPYSGITAASAYKELMGQDVRTVIVLAPSHTAIFAGASIPPVQAYRTPLGLVPLSPRAATLAGTKPFLPAPRLRTKRPAWWQKAPKQAPPPGEDTPHTWEHSLECQLPFLQWALREFRLVPIIFGETEPAEVAGALTPHLDDHTVIVASSDLSHHHSYNEARSLDSWCIEAVRGMDLDLMKRQEACGKGPILTLMRLAKERGWKPHVLDYRTSGDLPKASKDSVVGYMAAVFTEGEDEPAKALVGGERKFLLNVARQTLSDTVNKKPPPRVDRSTLTLTLLQPRGVFVTLNKDGELRGCIGYTLPRQALYRAVIENTISAATRDRRFPPVGPEELEKIRIDISVLTVPKKVYYNQPSDLLKRLRPHVDGVLLQVPVVVGGRQRIATSVYLPAVWDKTPEPEKFMDQLSLKAGLAANAWRQSAARVLTFQAEEFRETKE